MPKKIDSILSSHHLASWMTNRLGNQVYFTKMSNRRQAAGFDDPPEMGIENIISEDLYNEIIYASN